MITTLLRTSALVTIFMSYGSAARAQQDLTVVLTGQSMIRSDLRATAPDILTAIRPLLNGNVIFTNLEGAIALPGQTAQEGRGFLAPPEALDALQGLGFNLLALAGNHAFDLGSTGVENTLRESAHRGLVRAGTGTTLDEAAAPAYLHVGNMTVALVASASGLINSAARATPQGPGVNELRVNAGPQANEATADLPGAPANTPEPEDAQRILQSIRTAKQHADLVIVYQHNHVFGNESFATLFTEGMSERLAPNEWLRNWVHQEVEAGADIVVMHGAPLLHGVELFHGHPIFYDLGNFIYNLPPTLTYIDEPIAWESVIANLQFHGASLQSITLRPIVLNRIGRGQPDVHDPHTNNEFLDTRGLPSPASGAQATYILDRLAQLSAPLGTQVKVDGATARIDLPGHIGTAGEPASTVPDRLRPPPADELPLDAALEWAQAAVAACKSLGYPVTATYMNSYREIKVAVRADGARGSTADTGRRKAYTAIATGMSSEDYGTSMGYPPGSPAPQLPGKPIALPPGVSDENMIVAEGGLPLKNAAGKVIGAVSVSGALEHKDHVCAQAGLGKIAAFLR